MKGYKYFWIVCSGTECLNIILSCLLREKWLELYTVQEYYYLNLLFVCYLPYRKSYTLFFSDKNMNNGESVFSNTVLRCFSGVLKALNSDRLHIPLIWGWASCFVGQDFSNETSQLCFKHVAHQTEKHEFQIARRRSTSCKGLTTILKTSEYFEDHLSELNI